MRWSRFFTLSGMTDVNDQPVILDDLNQRLATFNALRSSDRDAADGVLAEMGGHGDVEREILAQLASTTQIDFPERFEEAHRLVMHSLEVLKRNGARGPRLPRHLGPLNPIAKWVVQLFVRLIVQSYISRIVDNIRHLYGRREAWTAPNTREATMLRRARMHADRVAVGYKGRALGLPTFLLGGAIVSSIFGVLRATGEWVRSNRVLTVSASLVILPVLLGAAWCVLRGAAIARKRIHLTTEVPMKALYETLGGCGRPPKDDANKFALLSLVAMAVAWVVIPVGIVLAVM